MAVCDNMTPSPLEESRHTGCVRGGVSLVGDEGTTPRRADQNQVRGSVTRGLHHSAGTERCLVSGRVPRPRVFIYSQSLQQFGG